MNSGASIMATEALPMAGALVYWRLEGSLDPQELEVLWAKAELPAGLLPAPPAPSTALQRAMKGLTSKRTLVRPLDGRGALALVAERADKDDLEHHVTLKVRLDAANRPIFEPAEHKLAPMIREEYDRQLDLCSAQDIGTWLCVVVRKFDGVGLREGGGFYYIPADQLARWDAAVAAIRRISAHQLFQIPAMRSDEAVAAILDALEQEATTEAKRMEDELASATLGGRALTGRVSHCEAVEAKIGRYEALLGGSLETLRARLETLRGALAVAAIQADTSDVGEAGGVAAQ